MKLSAMCLRCLIDRQEERTREVREETVRSAYMKEVAGVIARSGEEASAPALVYEVNKLYEKFFGALPDYEREKEEFNRLMLEAEPALEDRIRRAGGGQASPEEMLQRAMRYARTANYIDYGAMIRVDREELFSLLGRAERETLDEKTFRSFLSDMKTARRLVYLTDNCGEIVADKLLIKLLKELYPWLAVTVIVRGMPVLNDATLEDAKTVGLTGVTRVIANGNGVAGTQWELLSEEARKRIEEADLIVSKGQGNFETLHDCGRNVYYLFLCKCEWFCLRFGMERLKGVFVNEKDLRQQGFANSKDL